MLLYQKRKKFYETLKNITFTKDTIPNSCKTLFSAIETWEQTKKDKKAKEKSKSQPYLDKIKNYSDGIMLLRIKSVDDLSHHISKLLIQNLTNLKKALSNASNAKFDFWTFGAVLDSSEIKNELKRIANDIESTINFVIEKSLLLQKLSNNENYCYLNSAIQQLYKMKDFRTKVLDAKVDKSDEQHKELFALQQIFKMLQGKLKISDQELNKLRKDLGYNGQQEDSVEHMESIKTAVETQLYIIKKK